MKKTIVEEDWIATLHEIKTAATETLMINLYENDGIFFIDVGIWTINPDGTRTATGHGFMLNHSMLLPLVSGLQRAVRRTSLLPTREIMLLQEAERNAERNAEANQKAT